MIWSIFIYHQYEHTLAQQTLPWGGHEIFNFGKFFLGNYYYIYTLSSSDLCQGVEKKIFKDIH